MTATAHPGMVEFFGLDGVPALVTGASSGLGAHFARVLARAGAVVGLAARRAGRLEEVASAIAGEGGRAVPLAMDVTDAASVEQGLAAFEAAAGTPRILVNNAGMASTSRFVDAPEEEIDAVFDLNQRAAWRVAQAVCRRMIAAETGGSVVNIASITGLRPIGGAASYAVSKAAIVHLTQVMALELARHGIRVNALAPGYFDTELNRDFLASEAGQRLVRRIPMRRTGRPEELDGALLLLASERGGFVTGAVLPVDGGHLVSGL
jgi:NAD(P)-dependent dehydrogenase (short-subunit alcohol dehydrogenase family)